MQWQPHSHRNEEPPTVLTHELSERARKRILIGIKETGNALDNQEFGPRIGSYHLSSALKHAMRMTRLREGELAFPESHYEAYGDDGEIAKAHFMKPDTAGAVDFLEYMCRYEFAPECMPLDYINQIFREEGIGFELSRYVFKTIKTRQGTIRTSEVAVYPEVTMKTDETVHRDVVMPALSVLSRREFAAANEHLLKAHHHYRDGNNNREAITEALSALESTVKAICKTKDWPYRENKDTIDPLLQVLVDNKMIYDLYKPVVLGAATVRNRLVSHGQEPESAATPTGEHVEHMIHLVSAHILLLVRMAKIT